MAQTLIKTIKLPSGIHASLEGNKITLKGPKGTLTNEFESYRIKVEAKGDKIVLEGTPSNKQTLVLMETLCAHIRNMVEGLLYGYKYKLKVVYSHFPMTLQVEKGVVNIKNFLGEKFPRKAPIIGDTKVEVKGQDVTLTGTDKDAIGQTATNLELRTKVKNKDIRRFQDGIYIIEKGNVEEKKEGKLIEEIRGRE